MRLFVIVFVVRRTDEGDAIDARAVGDCAETWLCPSR